MHLPSLILQHDISCETYLTSLCVSRFICTFPVSTGSLVWLLFKNTTPSLFTKWPASNSLDEPLHRASTAVDLTSNLFHSLPFPERSSDTKRFPPGKQNPAGNLTKNKKQSTFLPVWAGSVYQWGDENVLPLCCDNLPSLPLLSNTGKTESMNHFLWQSRLTFKRGMLARCV